MDQLTFGSLFAGIGGFDLGFERAGMICKWQVEIDDYATKVLTKHWPNVHRERDIRECGQHNLQRVDVICGGFPCQDISYAGLGAGLDGERSGLFFEAIRLVCELRPRIVVLENVAALLTRGLDRVLGTLAEIGFDAEWHCIPAAAVGAPHIRDRVFIMAYARCELRYSTSNDDKRCGKNVADTNCERLPRSWIPEIGTKEIYDASGCCWWNKSSSSGLGIRKAEVLADTNGITNKTSKATFSKSTKRDARMGFTGRSWPCRPAGSWWATEPAVGRVANGIPARVDRLRGLGNAVVPQVAEYVGRRVVEVLTA